MDVLSSTKGVQHGHIIRHVRHNAQLNLGIVQRDEYIARIGDKAAPDSPAQVGAGGNVLQVRV